MTQKNYIREGWFVDVNGEVCSTLQPGEGFHCFMPDVNTVWLCQSDGEVIHEATFYADLQNLLELTGK